MQIYDYDSKALLLADSLTNIDREQHWASGKVSPVGNDSRPLSDVEASERNLVKSLSDVLGLPRVGQRIVSQTCIELNGSANHRRIKRSSMPHSIAGH